MVQPNNAFKPKPLRSTNHMADTACHVAGSTARLGLTWVLGPTQITSLLRRKHGNEEGCEEANQEGSEEIRKKVG